MFRSCRRTPRAFCLLLLPLFVRPCAAGSIKLAWDPNPEAFVTGYNVYRSLYRNTTCDPYSGGPLNGASPVSTTFFPDDNAAPGQRYCYVVRAVAASGQEGPDSLPVVAWTGYFDPALPPATANARAFPSTDVLPGHVVVLTGTAWSSATGPITYSWIQLAGPSVALIGADKGDASFIAPQASSAEPLVFGLTVKDSTGTVAAASTTVVMRH